MLNWNRTIEWKTTLHKINVWNKLLKVCKLHKLHNEITSIKKIKIKSKLNKCIKYGW